jgi:hypothetical protein
MRALRVALHLLAWAVAAPNAAAAPLALVGDHETLGPA